MISVEQHLERILTAVSPLAAVEVDLLDAQGCVLAQEVSSSVQLPGFDNSAMDGYAVRAEDVAGADPEHPVLLPVLGDIAAGSTEHLSIDPGRTRRIMTGAPVPAGADAIVPVELTDGHAHEVRILEAVEAGRHIRRAGEDVGVGDVLLRDGVLVGPRQIAVLAAVGVDRVRVVPRPHVSVLSTGDELIEPGTVPGFGQVVDSNGLMVTAAVRAAGAVARRVGRVADEAGAFSARFEAELDSADAIITTGGVSMGAFDTVKEVLSADGDVRFDQVAMQPGKPQGFGLAGSRAVPVFTLPGNPVSALVSFEVFVRPALARMAGRTHAAVAVQAVVGQGWDSPPGKVQYARVVLGPDGAGQYVVRLAGGQGSHVLGGLAAANALAVVPADVTRVEAGTVVEVRPLVDLVEIDHPDTRSRQRDPGRGHRGMGGSMNESENESENESRNEIGLSHVRAGGTAHMVDVSAKEVTSRAAAAAGTVLLSGSAVAALRQGAVPKGDALAVARIAGIQAAKRTPDLVPLAHPVGVHAVEVDLLVSDHGVDISARVRTADRTGIEMEALTAVTVAALALVDMVKAVDRHARITDVRVTAKSGGRSGDWQEPWPPTCRTVATMPAATGPR